MNSQIQEIYKFDLSTKSSFNNFTSNVFFTCYTHFASKVYDRLPKSYSPPEGERQKIILSYKHLDIIDVDLAHAIQANNLQFNLNDNDDYRVIVFIAMLGCEKTLNLILSQNNISLKMYVLLYFHLGKEFYETYIPSIERDYPLLSRSQILETYEMTRVKFYKLQAKASIIIFDCIKRAAFKSSIAALEECIQILESSYITQDIRVDALKFVTLVRDIKQYLLKYLAGIKNESAKKAFIEEIVYPIEAADTIPNILKVLARLDNTSNQIIRRRWFDLVAEKKEVKAIKMSEVVKYAIDMHEMIKQEFIIDGTSVRGPGQPHKRGTDIFLQALRWDHNVEDKLRNSTFLTAEPNNILYEKFFQLVVGWGAIKTLKLLSSHPLFLPCFLPQLVKVLNYDITKSLQHDYDNYVRSNKVNRNSLEKARVPCIATFNTKLDQMRLIFFRQLINTIKEKLYKQSRDSLQSISTSFLTSHHPRLLSALVKMVKEFFNQPENSEYVDDFSEEFFGNLKGKNLSETQAAILSSLLTFLENRKQPQRSNHPEKDKKDGPIKEFKQHHETYTHIKKILEKDDLDLLMELAKVLEELNAGFRDNAFYIKYRHIKSVFRPHFHLDPKEELKVGREELEEILSSPQIQKKKESGVIKTVIGNYIKDKLKPAEVINRSLSPYKPEPTHANSASNSEYLEEKEAKRVSAEKTKHLAGAQPQQAQPRKTLKEYTLNELIAFLYDFKLNDKHFNDGNLSLGLCYALLGNLARWAEEKSHRNLLNETLALEIPKTQAERTNFTKKIAHCTYRYRNRIFFPREVHAMKKAEAGGFFLELNTGALRNDYKPQITSDIEYYQNKRRGLKQ